MRAATIQDLTLNSTRVRGMVNCRLDPRLEHAAEGSSGLLHINAHHYMRSAPLISLTTRDVQAMWTLFSGNANAPSAALTTVHAIAAAADTAAPGYVTTSTHRRITNTKAHGFIDRISGESGGKVEIASRVFLLSSNGSALPFTDDAVAKVADDGAVTPYVVASATVGGTNVMPGFVRFEIDIGHNCDNNAQGSSYNGGLPHPVEMAMAGAHGHIEIIARVTIQDLSIFPANGNVVIGLAPLTAAGFAGSVNRTITLNGIIDPLLSRETSHGAPGTRELVCRGVQNGATLPLTLSAS